MTWVPSRPGACINCSLRVHIPMALRRCSPVPSPTSPAPPTSSARRALPQLPHGAARCSSLLRHRYSPAPPTSSAWRGVPCPNSVSFRCHQIGARDWLGRQDLEEERPICLGEREIGMEFASSYHYASGEKEDWGTGGGGVSGSVAARKWLGQFFLLLWALLF